MKSEGQILTLLSYHRLVNNLGEIGEKITEDIFVPIGVKDLDIEFEILLLPVRLCVQSSSVSSEFLFLFEISAKASIFSLVKVFLFGFVPFLI